MAAWVSFNVSLNSEWSSHSNVPEFQNAVPYCNEKQYCPPRLAILLMHTFINTSEAEAELMYQEEDSELRQVIASKGKIELKMVILQDPRVQRVLHLHGLF